MKKDIEDKKDIELLVNSFYEKVKTDSSINFFFSKVVPVNWEKHLPVMYTFWENIIFHSGGYTGNPMQVHTELHTKHALQKEHFEKWIALFNATVDELFEGEKASQAKQRAYAIATVMQIKISAMPNEERVY